MYDAIGVRMYQLPMTPDRVLEAIEKKARSRAPRPGKDSARERPRQPVGEAARGRTRDRPKETVR